MSAASGRYVRHDGLDGRGGKLNSIRPGEVCPSAYSHLPIIHTVPARLSSTHSQVVKITAEHQKLLEEW